jgi:hypothetical protein
MRTLLFALIVREMWHRDYVQRAGWPILCERKGWGHDDRFLGAVPKKMHLSTTTVAGSPIPRDGQETKTSAKALHT